MVIHPQGLWDLYGFMGFKPLEGVEGPAVNPTGFLVTQKMEVFSTHVDHALRRVA